MTEIEHITWRKWYMSLCKVKRQTIAIDYCLGEKVFSQGYMNQKRWND